jgi:nucleoside-diphosphate-sugar epimerase
MSMRVLIVGCGDVGSEIARRLLAHGHQVAGVRRSQKPFPAGGRLILADVTMPDMLKSLADFDPDIVVYCVAADAHTDESYRSHYVDGLRNTLAALRESSRLKHIFFISSSGVYGQQTDALLDETSPAIPADFSGERMLEAESLLSGYPATILRFSGIYGPGRTRMIQLASNPADWPARNGWTNRIHRDDGAAFVVFLIAELAQGQVPATCYVVTDSRPVALYELLLWLAQQQGVDTAGLVVPPVQGNKRLSNHRLLQTGFAFTYPDYRAGYQVLLSQQ